MATDETRIEHGLNTDQDSKQGQGEVSGVSVRVCVTISNLLPDLRFISRKKRLSGNSIRRFFCPNSRLLS